MWTCTVTDMSYIGKCKTSIEERSKQHFSGNGGAPYFWNAIRKYGEDKFQLKVLWEDTDYALLDDIERHCIKEYGTLVPNGYNIQEGGQGGSTRPEIWKQWDRICDMYTNQGMSVENIAQELKTCRNVIRRILMGNGVKMRPRGRRRQLIIN